MEEDPDKATVHGVTKSQTQLSNKQSNIVAETSTQETKHHTWRVGELRFIMLLGPNELTLQSQSPEQRGYRVFIAR